MASVWDYQHKDLPGSNTWTYRRAIRRREFEECEVFDQDDAYFWKKSLKRIDALHIKYQFHSDLRIDNKGYLSVVDHIIVFCCDNVFSLLMGDDDSVLSMPDKLSMEKLIGAADERQNRKASKITMQR